MKKRSTSWVALIVPKDSSVRSLLILEKKRWILLKQENPDLIILDIMLPDTEGTALSLDIREHSSAPIIFLSCKTQEIDKIMSRFLPAETIT